MPPYQIELDFIAALQGDGSWQRGMNGLSWLGADSFDYMLPVALYIVSRRAGIRLCLLTALSWIALIFLKIAFHTARPCWIDPRIHELAGWAGYGFPSGHAFLAATMWFSLAGSLRTKWAWSTSTVIVILTDISRLYLGVHSLCDVAAGTIFGFLLVVGAIRYESYILGLFRSWFPWKRLLAVGWFALVLWQLGQILEWRMETVIDPLAWSSHSVQARNLDGYNSSIRRFFELCCLLTLAQWLFRFELPKNLWLRFLICLYSIFGVKCLTDIFGWLPHIENAWIHAGVECLKNNALTIWLLIILPLILVSIGIGRTVKANSTESEYCSSLVCKNRKANQ